MLHYLMNDKTYQFHWIKQNPEILFFMHIFNARIVGGAVRNTLMNIDSIGDIDLATPFTPDEMIYIADIMKLKHIPTGISHGTITILSRRYSASYLTYIREILHNINTDTTKKLSETQQSIKNSCEFLIEHYENMQNLPEQTYEFTTLRDDVETDGRHAKIRYTKNWQTDADRRDFTINALYIDVNLQLHDLVNGMQDIRQSFIRFVGNPALRIQEDYLRILRFFRFNAHYGSDTYDLQALQACKDNVQGLKQISQERLFAEFNKLLKGKHALLAIEKMNEANIFYTLNWPQVNLTNLNIYQANLSLIQSNLSSHSYSSPISNPQSTTTCPIISNSVCIDHLNDNLLHTDHSSSTTSNNLTSDIITDNHPDSYTYNTSIADSNTDIHSASISSNKSSYFQSISSDHTHSTQSDTSHSLLTSLSQVSLLSEALFSTFSGNWNDLKMPKKTLQIIQSLQNNHPNTIQEWYAAFYHHGLDWIHAKILITPNLSIESILYLLSHFQHAFIFPIAGKDILEFCEAGPRIGALYNNILQWWLNNLCKASRDECLAYLHTLI